MTAVPGVYITKSHRVLNKTLCDFVNIRCETPCFNLHLEFPQG